MINRKNNLNAKETGLPVEKGSSMGGNADSLDMTEALERVGGDKQLLAEIAKLFLLEYDEIVTEIRSALTSRDSNNLERAAHNLKGSVANFGADAAVKAAFALEKLGRAGDLDGAAEAFGKLERQMQLLRPALEKLAFGQDPA